jgi:hypothetical protein
LAQASHAAAGTAAMRSIWLMRKGEEVIGGIIAQSFGPIQPLVSAP